MTNTFAPTAEQSAALAAFKTGKNMVIEAGAGTGKTSTLRLLAESTDANGLYIAYNKAIQTDAAKDFPSNCQCKTAHSLAYGWTIKNHPALMKRLNGPRIPSKEAVALLGIPSGGFQVNPELTLKPWIISRAAMDAVARFCNSADNDVTERHVRPIAGVEDHAGFAAYVAPFAKKAWKDLQDPNGRLTFSHDHYLKIWALSEPTLNCDFVLLDEAQDANPVISKIVEDQTHAQQVMVGDACQAIYGWRGAIDAMSSFTTDHRLLLSQSFRFGPAVAEQANKFLALLDASMRLSGFDQIDSTIETLEDPDVILCRTNAAVIEYAMDYMERGKKVAIVGGAGEIKRFVEGVSDLQSKGSSSHADLVAFKTWNDVVEYAESDEGRDLRVMVKMIINYGIEAILAVCSASVKEEDADIIVSTAHKAKGREWNKVRIANDFKAPQEGEEPSRTETMLAYVAVTRAKQVLDYSGLAWVDRYNQISEVM